MAGSRSHTVVRQGLKWGPGRRFLLGGGGRILGSSKLGLVSRLLKGLGSGLLRSGAAEESRLGLGFCWPACGVVSTYCSLLMTLAQDGPKG
jgi:hypothetical protein